MIEFDHIQHFKFTNLPIRGIIVRLKSTYLEVLKRRDYPHSLQILLGETLSACALLSGIIAHKGKLNLQIQTPRQLSSLLTQCDDQYTMRGLAEWSWPIDACAPLRFKNNDQLMITHDPLDGSPPFQDIVDLSGESLANSIEHYFLQTENRFTKLWLAADGQIATGLLIQQLPFAHKTRPLHLSTQWQGLVDVGNQLDSQTLLNSTNTELYHRLSHQAPIQIDTSFSTRFHCSCTQSHIEVILQALGYDEIQSILTEQKMVNVNCEFCNQNYEFDSVDIERIFTLLTPPSDKIH